MLTYYPPINTNAEYKIPVQAPHVLYVEESGNPNGIPVVVVHGGPGSGCDADNRRFFDPNIYRIILFDQRGAGRSTPHAELKHNNTAALVADMEVIRQFLQVDQWLLFGGSWGSTLSLVYGETHPENVLGFILRGIFLAREQDLNWVYQDPGANQVFPDYWQEFISPIPPHERAHIVDYYYQLLTSENEIARLAAAKTWSAWEGRMLKVLPDQQATQQLTEAHTALSFARIGCHYMRHHCFLKPNQILANLEKINHLPCIIVHGRYDMICLIDNAWQLYQAWPGSELDIIPAAGHSRSEPGILDGLIRATQKMPHLLRSTA